MSRATLGLQLVLDRVERLRRRGLDLGDLAGCASRAAFWIGALGLPCCSAKATSASSGGRSSRLTAAEIDRVGVLRRRSSLATSAKSLPAASCASASLALASSGQDLLGCSRRSGVCELVFARLVLVPQLVVGNLDRAGQSSRRQADEREAAVFGRPEQVLMRVVEAGEFGVARFGRIAGSRSLATTTMSAMRFSLR